MATRIITVNQIAQIIQKAEEDITLPNGVIRRGLNWMPSDLLAVEAALKPFSATGEVTLVDGIGPQWLMTSIVHGLHPCSVILADPKVDGGQVPIDDRRKPGVSTGDLQFTITKFATSDLVEYGSDIPISPEGLANLVPPGTRPGLPVALSGRTATWAVVQIAMAYAHMVPAVFVNQPGTGFVCAISHNPRYKVGDVAATAADISEKTSS